MAGSAVVKIGRSRAGKPTGPVIRLQRSADGFSFAVSYLSKDGREDPPVEFSDYDAALRDAQERAHRHRVSLRDETGVEAPKAPKPNVVPFPADHAKAADPDALKRAVEDLPDLFEAFDLPDLPDDIDSKFNFPLLETHAAARFKALQARAIDEHLARFGDSRNVPRTFDQRTYDVLQGEIRLIVENALVKHLSLAAYLEQSFARIAELEAAPRLHYRGIFKASETYPAGAICTWGGSAWICMKATNAKPDTEGGDWALMVKRGRDGKDLRNA